MKLEKIIWEQEMLFLEPQLQDNTVRKFLQRGKCTTDTQHQVYDILVQSTETDDSEIKKKYYKRAHQIDPFYVRDIDRRYRNTDAEDLAKLFLELPHILKEKNMKSSYIIIQWVHWYKKIDSWYGLKERLQGKLHKDFINTIEAHVKTLWISNYYEIYISMLQSGIRLNIALNIDNDSDVTTENENEADDKMTKYYYWPINFTNNNRVWDFIRSRANIKDWDIEDCLFFE